MVYNHAPALWGRNNKDHALVAQMDRVLASEAKGRGFDSRRARHQFLQPTFVGFFLPGKRTLREFFGASARCPKRSLIGADYRAFYSVRMRLP